MFKRIAKVSSVFKNKYLNKISSFNYDSVDDLHQYASDLWSKRFRILNNASDKDKAKILNALRRLLGVSFSFKREVRNKDLNNFFVKKYIDDIKQNLDTLMRLVRLPEVREILGDFDYQTNLVLSQFRALPSLKQEKNKDVEKNVKEDVEEEEYVPPVPEYLLEGYDSQEEYDNRPRTYEAVQTVRRDLFDF